MNEGKYEESGDNSAAPGNSKSISLVIPVYNEGEHLEKFLQSIDNLELPLAKELVIVDDSSTDNSKSIIDAFPFKSAVVIVKQPFNQGKGAAIRAGIERASGTFIGVQDADFEYDIKDIPRLVEPLIQGRADIVFGSRFKHGEQVHRTLHYLVNRFLTMLSNIFSGLYLSDMETCYKFFLSDILKNIVLESNRFGFEPEITAKIAKLRARVVELPISYFPRNYLEGKKITWKDGIAAMRHILYFNLFSSNKPFKPGMPSQYLPRSGNWLNSQL